MRWGWFTVKNFRDVVNGAEASRDLFRGSYSATIYAAGSRRDKVAGPAGVIVEEGVGTVVYAIGSPADGTFGLLEQTYDLGEVEPATGKVSVVHGVPGLTVDVYLNGEVALPEFEPGTITDRIELPVGDYDIAIAPAGTSIDDAVISGAATVTEGLDATAVAHLAEDGSPTLSLFVNDVSSTRIFLGRVALRHCAAAPAVDISLARGWWDLGEISDLANGMEAVVELIVGNYHATIFPAEGDDPVADPATIPVRPFALTVIYAVGSLEDGTFQLLSQRLPLGKSSGWSFWF